MKFPFSYLVLCLLSAAAVSAQSAEQLHQVRLRDGTTIVGRIENQDSLQVTVVSLGGVSYVLKRADIRELGETSGRVVNGEFWAADPNDTRLFFTATGRSVGKGGGYIGTYFIALPFVAIGVTDRFTIAGGAPLLFGQFEPFYLAPKYQVLDHDNAAVSLGTLSFFAGDEEFDSFGLVYAVGTFGSRDHALTTGLGFGYAGEDVASKPALAVGFELRVSRKVKLLSENYAIPGGFSMVSGGLRIMGDRFSADVGMMRFSDGDDSLCCAPIINFAYAVGRRR